MIGLGPYGIILIWTHSSFNQAVLAFDAYLFPMDFKKPTRTRFPINFQKPFSPLAFPVGENVKMWKIKKWEIGNKWDADDYEDGGKVSM